jgi:hypothetical protein
MRDTISLRAKSTALPVMFLVVGGMTAIQAPSAAAADRLKANVRVPATHFGFAPDGRDAA